MIVAMSLPLTVFAALHKAEVENARCIGCIMLTSLSELIVYGLGFREKKAEILEIVNSPQTCENEQDSQHGHR